MPDFRRAVARRVSRLRLDPARQLEIVDEISQHLHDRYDELRVRGLSDADATHDALSEIPSLAAQLSGVEHPVPLDPPVFASGGRTVIDALLRDIRYALRTFARQPVFTAVATLTLALGIGATTAIFSVVNAVMLRPLPFATSDRLVRIWESDLKHGRPEFSVSEPNFLDFRAQNSTFERLVAVGGATLNLTTPEGAEPLAARRVTTDFLPALGVSPALGRNFLPEEDRPGGNIRVAIVTHALWQRRLGGDPQAVGRTLSLNFETYTVVGVLPSSFTWTTATLDVLVPLAPDPAAGRGDHQLTAFGLLKPGVSLEQANADLHGIAERLSAQYPESNEGWSVLLRSFYDWLVPVETRRMLVVFVAAVGFVLLIAAGNVANLLLARAAARQKEMSLRVALGASRPRVLSQLLIESLLLALIGGAAGSVLAVGATAVLKALAPAGAVPRLDEVVVDGRVLAFTFLVSIATGLVFGLAPAIYASRPDMSSALKDAGRSGSGGAARQRLRDALVTIEVALSVALLIGAGLLVRSMWTLQGVSPGFDPHNLLTLQVNVFAQQGAARGAAGSFYRDALTRITALPGVTSATASSLVPFGIGNTSIQITIDGRPADSPGLVPFAMWRVVGSGYFKTLGVSLRGRDFDDRDPRAPVAIISEDMARRYWPGVDPIGRQFYWFSTNGPKLTIIGVAGDMRNLSLETDPGPIVYRPATALPVSPMYLMVRTASDPAAQATAVRAAIRSANPNVPVSNVRTVDEIIARSTGQRRFNMVLLGTFAAIALVLASVGLFGVMSYLVSQRTHDIGVRLALGAHPRDIFRLIVGRGMALAGAGAAAGLAAALGLSRSLATLLFQVQPTDPATFTAVVFMLLGVALLACAIPARRATRVDPVVALRHE